VSLKRRNVCFPQLLVIRGRMELLLVTDSITLQKISLKKALFVEF